MKKKNGFTLAEMMIVVVMVIIFVAVAIPVVKYAINRDTITSCQ